MNYGIKVSQEGYDVKTASDTQFVFSSKFGTWASACISVSGSASGNDSSGTIDFSIAHNLGYTPFILIYYVTSVSPNNWQWFPNNGNRFLLGLGDSPVPTFLNVFNDHFTFSFLSNAGESVTIKYFLFNVAT